MNLNLPNILEILCILVFGSIIFVWVVRYKNIKDEFKTFNLPKWLRDLVGILKLSFAIMLLNDNLEFIRLGAVGIAILMVAALHSSSIEEPGASNASFIFLTMHMLLYCLSLFAITSPCCMNTH